MPARLHHERVAAATATRWLALVHGIYGSGGNLRTIARKLVERRPEWGIALVDLRGHGRSELGDPPHTIAACADDVRAFIAALDVPVDALAGHSLGGKVMLAARASVHAQQTWVLDASPSAGAPDDRDSVALLAVMEQLPARWTRREDFVAAITAAGHPASLGQWLAMNLVADGSGFALRLDLGAMRALLASYFATDLWAALADPAPGAVHLVVATRAHTLSSADRARAAALPPHVTIHEVPTGHWLHVEAPATVVDLLASSLP
jgi:esterase